MCSSTDECYDVFSVMNNQPVCKETLVAEGPISLTGMRRLSKVCAAIHCEPVNEETTQETPFGIEGRVACQVCTCGMIDIEACYESDGCH